MLTASARHCPRILSARLFGPGLLQRYAQPAQGRVKPVRHTEIPAIQAQLASLAARAFGRMPGKPVDFTVQDGQRWWGPDAVAVVTGGKRDKVSIQAV